MSAIEMQAAAKAFLVNPTQANEEAVRETSKAYGMGRRMIDQRIQGLRSRAKGLPVVEQCDRCAGTGQYMDYGQCFDCNGSGRKAEA